MTDGTDFCSVTIDQVTRMHHLNLEPPFKYAYAYIISIHNISMFHTFQILSRKWIVKDGDMKDKIVEGSKVVGRVPILKANQTFRYQSYHVMQTSFGEASGAYYGTYMLESDPDTYTSEEGEIMLKDGDPFFVKIPSFKLITVNK